MEIGFNFNLGNLKINQLGYLYKDIEKQAKIIESLYGIPKFAFFENKDNTCKYRGRDSGFSTKIGISRLFNTQIELIQLLEGECIFKEFFDSGREGLHHFGIFVDNLDSYIEEFKKKGIEVVHAAQTGKQKFAYFDTEKTFGIYLEFQETIKRKKKR
ncbi:MAG: VOC family protein [Candidatus Hermodarchaeota archaeon]